MLQYVHDHKAPGPELAVPGADSSALGPLAVHRPEHAHTAHLRLSQRGQVELSQQGHARRRRGAALRVHHQVALRRSHRLQVPALASGRHARHTRPRARGAQHHRDAGHHGHGALARLHLVHHGRVRAVRLLD